MVAVFAATFLSSIRAQTTEDSPLYQWTFGGNTYGGGTWDGRRFVVVTDRGSVGFSPDGRNWDYVHSTATSLSDIAWFNNAYVASGRNGIYHSSDGSSWAKIMASPNDVELDRVYEANGMLFAYGGTRFASVATGGATVVQEPVLLGSPDGLTWVSYPVPTTGAVTGFARFGGRYILITHRFATGTTSASASDVYSSDNLLTWTKLVSIPAGILSLATDDATMVAASSNTVYSSMNGTLWTERRARTNTSAAFRRVIFANGRFVVAQTGLSIGNRTTGALYSSDGITWFESNAQRKESYGFTTVFASPTQFILVGQAGAMAISDDRATTWALLSDGYFPFFSGGFSTGNGRFIRLSSRNSVQRIQYSDDGYTWRPADVPRDASSLNAVAYGNGRFVAVASPQASTSSMPGVVFGSTTGETWTIDGSVPEHLAAVAFGANRFIAGGRSGGIYTSSDGRSWTRQQSGTTSSINALAWDGQKIVAVTANGPILTSTDGINWRQHQIPQPPNLVSVAGNGTRWVAVGEGGTIVTSADGETWTARTPIGGTLSSVVWTGRHFLLVGGSFVGGTINTRHVDVFRSLDGVQLDREFQQTPWGGGAPSAAVAGGKVVIAQSSEWFFAVASATPITRSVQSPVSYLANLSIRTSLSAEEPTFKVGTVVGGAGTSGSKPLVIRAVGPSLSQFGLTDQLTDARIDVYAGAGVSTAKVASNDDWGGSNALSEAMARVGAFGFTGATSRDATVAPSFSSGDYVVEISGAPNAFGTVLAELYDATPTGAFTSSTPRLINASVLKRIAPTLTAGFVISGTASKAVLIRAIGPGLAAFAVSGFLADPRIELFDSNNRSVAANDDWRGEATLATAASAVGAFAIPTDSKDSAILATLAPGAYTVEIRGAAETAGLALVEIYEAR